MSRTPQPEERSKTYQEAYEDAGQYWFPVQGLLSSGEIIQQTTVARQLNFIIAYLEQLNKKIEGLQSEIILLQSKKAAEGPTLEDLSAKISNLALGAGSSTAHQPVIKATAHNIAVWKDPKAYIDEFRKGVRK